MAAIAIQQPGRARSWKAAVAMDKAKGVNVYGAGYKKSVVVVTPGGK